MSSKGTKLAKFVRKKIGEEEGAGIGREGGEEGGGADKEEEEGLAQTIE
jgi:hypothetical protein